MAAAAAALANSLGAASCGMGSPGVSQSNPLLGQYAALLGLARSPSGGPGTSACPLPCFTLVSMLNVAHSLMGQYATTLKTEQDAKVVLETIMVWQAKQICEVCMECYTCQAVGSRCANIAA